MSEPTRVVPPESGASPARSLGSRPLSGWVAPAALALAVISIALGAWALLRPTSAGTARPATDKQISDAKTRACTAYDAVRAAVSLQTHADPGSDPVAVQAFAANARLSMAIGASYLLAHLDPATPPPLSAAVVNFADDLQSIAINALAGVSNDDPALAARLRDGEAASARVADLCK